jgi:hypothetical protein
MSDMVDVEIPRTGTVIVQDTEVHDAREKGTKFVPCWCIDDRHSPVYREDEDGDYSIVRGMVSPRSAEPHLIGVQLVEMTWEVKR